MTYIRNAEVVFYFWYKVIALSIPHVLFAFQNGFSAMTVFDEFFFNMYNTLFTALPIMTKSLFDWDVNPDVDGTEYVGTLPYLYYIGQERVLMNKQNFMKECFFGTFHACIIYYIPLYAFNYDISMTG